MNKPHGETFGQSQQRRNTRKECPLVFIRISILRDTSEVEAIPSE